LTCLFTFLFTVRALRRCTAGGPRTAVEWLGCELGALTATFFLASAGSFWDSAIEAEVYSLSSCIIALTIWLGFNWWDHLGGPGNRDSLRADQLPLLREEQPGGLVGGRDPDRLHGPDLPPDPKPADAEHQRGLTDDARGVARVPEPQAVRTRQPVRAARRAL